MSSLQQRFDAAAKLGPQASQVGKPYFSFSKAKKFTPVMNKERIDSLLSEDLFTEEVIYYLMNLPLRKKPYFQADKTLRADMFKKKGITEYKFVQPIINALDAAKAERRFYSPNLWMFKLEPLIRKSFSGRILSDAALLVWDPTSLSARIRLLCDLIHKAVAEGIKSGCIKFEDYSIKVIDRIDKATSDGEQKSGLRNTVEITVNGPSFLKGLNPELAKGIMSDIADNNLSSNDLDGFDSNLYLKSDPIAMSTIKGVIDDLLNSLFKTETKKYVKQVRKSNLRILTQSVFGRLVNTSPTNIYTSLRETIIDDQVDLKPAKSTYASLREPEAKMVEIDPVSQFNKSHSDESELIFKDDKESLKGAMAIFQNGYKGVLYQNTLGYMNVKPIKRGMVYNRFESKSGEISMTQAQVKEQ